MRQTARQRGLVAVLGWGAALLLFFPIFWMALTSLRSEVAAIATPPQLVFQTTLKGYAEVQSRAESLRFAFKSVVVSLGGTFLALPFAKLSAASTLAVAPTLVFGWLSQRQLVRGLTFGAVK